MSSTYAEPLDRLHGVLDELAAISPGFRSMAERQDFLLGVAGAKARIAAEELRVLAASDDIAAATGDRSTATWLAHQTREAHGSVRRHAVLATALESRWTQTAEALGAGDVNLAQARVIVESLAALPKDLADDLLVKAEAYLVEQAATWVRASSRTSAAVSSSTSPPTSPTRPTTGGCSRKNKPPPPPPGSRCDAGATGPPTSTPGSPTRPPPD